jgi:hypothetical protein
LIGKRLQRLHELLTKYHAVPRWVPARALRSGDHLATETGVPARVLAVHDVPVAELATANLEVWEHHTSFVGQSAVLVHNDGEARIWRVYVGFTTDGNFYIGRTQQDVWDPEIEHHRDAKLEPEKYGFKKDIRVEQAPDMDGLTYDEALWHERRVFDQYKQQYGTDRVKNIEAPPTSDERIFELRQKYC